MDPSYYSQWLHQQPQQLLAESTQQSHPEVRPSSSSLDDWAKAATPNGQAGAVSSPHAATASMDLNDLMSDIGGESWSRVLQWNRAHGALISGSSAAGSTLSPTQSFYAPFQHNYFAPAPYNSIPYGTSWSAQPSHVPLSNYSSLNGATSTTPTSNPSTSSASQQPQHPPQQLQQQQQSPPPQPMMIE